MCLPLLIFTSTIKSRSSLLVPAHSSGAGKGPENGCDGGGTQFLKRVVLQITGGDVLMTHM